MSPTARRIAGAALAGGVLAAAAVAGVLALAGDDEPDVDGTFTLSEPGIYAEPITTVALSGDRLPELELEDAAGNAVGLGEFAGQPLVINVWYSSCPGCAREVADFAEVGAEHAGHVQFLGINPVDTPEAMTEFADARGVTYPLLLDAQKEFVTEVGITGFPTTLFVSADGVIVHQSGLIDADDLRSTIDAVF